MDNYPIKLEIRIDWSELDLFGHVNNVAYFKYIQASRINFWEAIGLTESYKNNNLGVMLASTSCTFLKPLFYPGNIVIQARVSFIKNTSFGFHHQVINSLHEIVAEADDIMVLYDFTKNEKVPFHDSLRDTIEKLNP